MFNLCKRFPLYTWKGYIYIYKRLSHTSIFLVRTTTDFLYEVLWIMRPTFIKPSMHLIRKDFKKACNVGYIYGLWKKGILQSQKVFEGFKDLGSTIHRSSFSYCLCREQTYNLVNLNDQNSLNIGHTKITNFSFSNPWKSFGDSIPDTKSQSL